MDRLKIALAALAAVTVAGIGVTAAAQYPGRDNQRDYPRTPLDDFFDRMGRNNPNPTLTCQTYKRLNREGEIVWIRMECTAAGR